MASDDPIMASVAGRYASALFELAGEQKALAAVEKDLVAIHGLIGESADFRRLVKSPVFSAEEQARALAAVLERIGAHKLTTNFFKLIASNRRLFAAEDMIKAFRAFAASARGEMAADVASAAKLSPAQLDQLKDTLRAKLGKDVQINAVVDPSLLGGLVVKVGSRMIDSSLKTKLQSLKTRMKEVG